MQIADNNTVTLGTTETSGAKVLDNTNFNYKVYPQPDECDSCRRRRCPTCGKVRDPYWQRTPYWEYPDRYWYIQTDPTVPTKIVC